MKKSTLPILTVLAVCTSIASAADWPQWAGSNSNNMVSPETNLPTEFTSGEGESIEEIMNSASNLKWVVQLGSQTYGTPTIAGGRVLVGTNNEEPRNENIIGDRGVVMSFNEENGDFQWQLTTQKLGAGKVSDWEFLGMCSSALVDKETGTAYIVTNRGEVLCLDLDGMADGNDGPFMDEGKYLAAGLDGMATAQAVEAGDTDADIIWGYDMRGELGVFPHNVTSSSVATDGERIFVTTSNGVDWSHINVPAPLAPALIVLDKKTGELLGEEDSVPGEEIMHCNWSSPGYVEHEGRKMILFGAGDGYLYGLSPETEKDADGFDILKELFKYDCNKKEYRFNESGEPIKYATYPGPSELISTPVYHKGKLYAAIGQDPEHGEGVGLLSCIDASSEGLVKPEDALWTYDKLLRTISTPSVTDDGLVFITDYSGILHCVDSETGEGIWTYDTLSHIWGSTLVADGKVYLGNEDGEIIVIKAAKDADANGDGEVDEDEALYIAEFPAPIYSSPVAANGVLYVTTQTHLYAFAMDK